MIEIFSDIPLKSLPVFVYLWKSLVIFGNFRKMFENVFVALGQLLENHRKYLRHIVLCLMFLLINRIVDFVIKIIKEISKYDRCSNAIKKKFN